MQTSTQPSLPTAKLSFNNSFKQIFQKSCVDDCWLHGLFEDTALDESEAAYSKLRDASKSRDDDLDEPRKLAVLAVSLDVHMFQYLTDEYRRDHYVVEIALKSALFMQNLDGYSAVLNHATSEARCANQDLFFDAAVAFTTMLRFN